MRPELLNPYSWLQYSVSNVYKYPVCEMLCTKLYCAKTYVVLLLSTLGACLGNTRHATKLLVVAVHEPFPILKRMMNVAKARHVNVCSLLEIRIIIIMYIPHCSDLVLSALSVTD